MGRLTAAELSLITDFATSAPIGTPTDPLPRPTLIALRDLIGADEAEYFELRRADRAVLAFSQSDDEEPAAPGSEEALHVFGAQNPLNWRRWRPADGALRLSDRIGRRELQRLEFYDAFMRPNGLRDTLKVWLWSSAESAACVQLWRRGADFSRRDQSVLAVVHHDLIRLRDEALIPRNVHAAALTFTPREAEVLILACRGESDAAIAERLGTSPATVGKHLQHAYDTLGVHSRSQALWRLIGAAGSDRTEESPPS